MTLHAGDAMAAIHLVRNDFVPESGVHLGELIAAGRLTVNLRAEAAPELLELLLRESLAGIADWRLAVDHVEAFRPGRPEPTHRDPGHAAT